MATNFILTLDRDQRKVRDGERTNKPGTHGSKTKFRVAIIARQRKIGKMYQIAIDPVTDTTADAQIMTSREVYVLNSAAMVRVGLEKHVGLGKNRAIFRFMPRDSVRDMRNLARIGQIGLAFVKRESLRKTVAR